MQYSWHVFSEHDSIELMKHNSQQHNETDELKQTVNVE